MKRILVPTDFSEQASFAMDLACQIAQHTGAELAVLHVIDHSNFLDVSAAGSAYPIMGNPASLEMDKTFLESMYKNADEKCTKFITSFGSYNLNIIKKVMIGNTFLFIMDEIRENKADLVIMGSKGCSGLEEVLIGSNTEKIVRHSRCPVLTVKSKVNLGEIHDIAFATNFHQEDDQVAVELKKMQKIFQAKLHLVRINTPNDFETNRKIMANAKNFINANEISDYTINIYNDKVEEDGIIFFAQDIRADLIAMATHGRTGLLHLLSGSIAEDVVNHANTPVWTFRLKH